MAAKKIDISCDMGESFGLWKMGRDEQMVDYITSANVACGYHGGDPRVMFETVQSCKAHGVRVGAHVGFPDLMGFGRRPMQCRPEEVRDYLVYQTGALKLFLDMAGVELQHVKPHGSLYMMAAEDERLSRVILETVARIGGELPVYCMRESATYELGKKMGVPVVVEFYPDRGMRDNGHIIFVYDIENVGGSAGAMAERAVRCVVEGKVRSNESGKDVVLEPDSVCLHGDTPHAIEFAKAIREAFAGAGIEAAPLAGSFTG
jgi:UPF0271 protein